MNNLAFQIYGLKKNVFQSTWDTNLTEVSTIQLATTATGANWSGTSYTLGYTHTPGSTVALTSSIVSQIGFNFRLVATITNRTAGSVNINWGGTSNTGIFATTTLELLTTSTAAQLLITPTSDFDGTIAISLRCTSAPSNQLKLPLVSTGVYNFWVDWGDGSYDNITSWNQAQRIHTYAVPGTYTTRITGIITGWESVQGNNYFGDRKKLISVASWGKLKPSTRGFDGCSNMTLNTVNDLLDLSHLTTMQFMFANCTALTVIGRSSEWKTSTITSLDNCFYNSINFNSPLNGWDTSNVTNMGGMFLGCTNFNQNLNNWNVSKVTFFIGGPITSGIFGNCTNFNNGFATGIANQLTWTINTTSSVNMASMFANCTSFNANLGTGTTPWNVSKVTSFSDMFGGASKFNNGDDSAPINDWSINTVSTVNMSNMFYNASFFNRDISGWNMSKVNNTNGMFAGASIFTNGDNLNTNPITLRSGIDGWDTSNVISMASMFNSASVFNRYITNWDVSKVTDMSNMFNLTIFNNGYTAGTIGVLPWNTISVVSMGNMFNGNGAFNQDISLWNVSSVASFDQAFRFCSLFNNGGSPNINNWIFKSTGTVNCNAMFWGASKFDQPVVDWNMDRVITTRYMFLNCSIFNQSINGWDLSSVTNFEQMFGGCTKFNNGFAVGIGNTLTLTLNTTTSVTPGSIFTNCPAFNCDVNSLNFIKFTSLNSIFAGCILFNNGLTPGATGSLSLNISNATDVGNMFNGCTSFNQDIGLFNVNKVTNFSAMLFNTHVYNNGADANPINNWTLNTTVGANINMTQMFAGNSGAKVFNRALNNWNTSEVTNMSSMFLNSGGSHSFNQPIDNWNTAKVTNMLDMFNGNAAFNQDISAWNVSQVTNFTNFMLGKTPTTFPSTYLDAIYNGWIVNGVKPNINISFGTAKYSQAGKPGKDTLLASPNNWTITDGLLTVSGTSNNGGLIRVTTTAAHGFTTGNSVYIYGVNGTTNANGTWTVTVVNTIVIELQGSTYNAAWTSGGNVILG